MDNPSSSEEFYFSAIKLHEFGLLGYIDHVANSDESMISVEELCRLAQTIVFFKRMKRDGVSGLELARIKKRLDSLDAEEAKD
jgi:hypothetical protein